MWLLIGGWILETWQCFWQTWRENANCRKFKFESVTINIYDVSQTFWGSGQRKGWPRGKVNHGCKGLLYNHGKHSPHNYRLCLILGDRKHMLSIHNYHFHSTYYRQEMAKKLKRAAYDHRTDLGVLATFLANLAINC